MADTHPRHLGAPEDMDFEAGDEAVVATANVTLHDFLAELGRRGKSVTATGGTDHQTLAGLISTGTAPASSRHALYELLDWVELVTVDPATGRAVERRISRGDADFPAAVCSLGLLGVLTRVRFRLVDELYFAVVQKIVDLDDVLADLDATSARVRLLARQLGAEEREGAALGGNGDPARAVEAGRRLPHRPFRARARRRLRGARQAHRHGAAADRRAGGGLRRDGLHLRESHATGPLRNMLPVDRRAPLHVAMAEWSFRPQDTQRVLGECRATSTRTAGRTSPPRSSRPAWTEASCRRGTGTGSPTS